MSALCVIFLICNYLYVIPSALQLLEEICNLGRAPEYICQKPSIQKADGTVTVPPARSNHAAEEASSEDEEEEEALHTFTQQQGEPESNRQLVF